MELLRNIVEHGPALYSVLAQAHAREQNSNRQIREKQSELEQARREIDDRNTRLLEEQADHRSTQTALEKMASRFQDAQDKLKTTGSELENECKLHGAIRDERNLAIKNLVLVEGELRKAREEITEWKKRSVDQQEANRTLNQENSAGRDREVELNNRIKKMIKELEKQNKKLQERNTRLEGVRKHRDELFDALNEVAMIAKRCV